MKGLLTLTSVTMIFLIFHIYCVTNKKISSKLVFSFIVPSTQAAFAICIAREIICVRKLPALISSVHMHKFLESLFRKKLGPAAPRTSKAIGSKIYPSLIKSL